jgi:arsenite methyltransferase
METKKSDEIKDAVRELYAEIARQQTPSCCAPRSEESSSCCSSCAGEVSRAQRLYSREELESIAADIPSLGCGNPIALSELQAGEVVLDLGSGGGLDCFLAARRVGPEGKVIGLDMTPDMIKLARANAEKLSVENAEFRLGEMEHMPIESDSVDVVISNCVINLSPDKDAVFREVYRVLKPGGRLCVSDIVTRGEMPASVRGSLEQWAGCVAGALDEGEYLGKIQAAGFVHLEREEAKLDPYKEEAALKVDAPIASISVKAFKPEQTPR